MCGIAVLVSKTPLHLSKHLLEMNTTIRHRGPDDEGYLQVDADGHIEVSYGNDTPCEVRSSSLGWSPTISISAVGCYSVLGMAHRRLSIVDTSPSGHQPMARANERFWICFNGEIYNHVEIRAELSALGHQFSTKSDTEVILAAYQEWGTDCLHHFNGMWAFSIFDRERRTLFFARDRFGVKPLYYHLLPHGLIAVVSEIKQLTVLPNWKPRCNPRRIRDFLLWNVMDHTEETQFDRVFQVPPGHFFLLDTRNPNLNFSADGRLPTTSWYSNNTSEFHGSEEDAELTFGNLLNDAVRLRLRADVSVGSCLSGGLDSSTIVCLMAKQLEASGSRRPNVFSAVSDEASVDERKWVDLVVQETKSHAHQVLPVPEHIFDKLPKIAWHQDEPFSSTSIFAQWSVYRLVRQNGVRVILNGQGADELLAGYHTFFAPRLASLLRQGRFVELTQEIVALRRELGYSPMFALQRMGDMMLPPRLRQLARSVVGRPSAFKNSWLSEAYNDEDVGAPTSGGIEQTTSVRELSRTLLTRKHLPMLLHWEDRNSMANSVESRMPFLDYRLVEFCLSLPDKLKLHRGVTKCVMRGAMRGVLPEPIRQRRDKIGFATPEEEWFKHTARSEFELAIDKAIEQSLGILTPNAKSHVDDIRAGKRPFSFLPWRMISLGAWIDRFRVDVGKP